VDFSVRKITCGEIEDPQVLQDRELYEKLLGLTAPRRVRDVDLQITVIKVTFRLPPELK
jgi:hypothetical protein